VAEIGFAREDKGHALIYGGGKVKKKA